MAGKQANLVDHCRIGSLENTTFADAKNRFDHCRIGSLENSLTVSGGGGRRSLPHRQLRKSKAPKII